MTQLFVFIVFFISSGFAAAAEKPTDFAYGLKIEASPPVGRELGALPCFLIYAELTRAGGTDNIQQCPQMKVSSWDCPAISTSLPVHVIVQYAGFSSLQQPW